MNRSKTVGSHSMNRRGFLWGGVIAAGTAAAATHMPNITLSAAEGRSITEGDIAILRFLAAAELLETDLWQQYAELGGANSPESGYRAALEVLDEDMPQYISDNTDDELSHAAFLNAYLASKGARPVNLDAFRTLPGNQATGAQAIGRLTNLMQLTVDTSWWTRYRSTEEPRSRRHLPTGDTEPECRSTSRDPAQRHRDGRREQHQRPRPGYWQHGGISFCVHRARRYEPLLGNGAESDALGSAACRRQYRPH